MIGEECPQPGMATFQAMFCVPLVPLLQRVGMFVSSETPSSCGPRQHGHSLAKAVVARTAVAIPRHFSLVNMTAEFTGNRRKVDAKKSNPRRERRWIALAQT
jgi:hypothetical protein